MKQHNVMAIHKVIKRGLGIITAALLKLMSFVSIQASQIDSGDLLCYKEKTEHHKVEAIEFHHCWELQFLHDTLRAILLVEMGG